MEHNINAGQQKVQEYIARIKAGESKESIMQGLPQSFVVSIENGLNQPEQISKSVLEGTKKNTDEEIEIPPQYKGLDSETLDFIWTIPVYIDEAKNKKENERKQKVIKMLQHQEQKELQKINDDIQIEELRADLGTLQNSDITTHAEALDIKGIDMDAMRDLIEEAIEGKKQAVKDLYQNFVEHIEIDETRKNLIKGLFDFVYKKYRNADYVHNPEEEHVWNTYLQSTNIPIDNRRKEWMYRGMFPNGEDKTLTRGSFNVHVTPELIDSLDTLISSGKLRANYKFGQPDTPASPTERHDSVSIYFLEEPSEESLEELSAIIKPYVRGDNLLGKKISDGFFMSEVGSIESGHIEKLIEDLKLKDKALAAAVEMYTIPRSDKKESLKMSEAQFYSIKDVAQVFGCSISYDSENGFILDSI